MLPSTPLFGPIPGGPELLIIVAIAVLLFGAQKIPKLARSVARASGEFQKGRTEVEQELDELTADDTAAQVDAESETESVQSAD